MPQHDPAPEPAPSRRRAATRERLIAAAVSVFAKRGVMGASVEEICEAAGFTRGAFYSNFDTKDDLCIAVLEANSEQTVRASIEAASLASPESDDLDAMIAKTVAAFMALAPVETEAIIARAELRLYAARAAAIRPAFHALEDANAKIFEGVIDDVLTRCHCAFVMPYPEALSLLNAVYDWATIEQVHRGFARDTIAEQLSAVLKSLVVPLEFPATATRPVAD